MHTPNNKLESNFPMLSFFLSSIYMLMYSYTLKNQDASDYTVNSVQK